MLPREQLYERLDRAAVVVFPSRRDGFPITCAEAMAHGRAVVATAVGGLPGHGRRRRDRAARPSPRDPPALRAAIDSLLADPELRRRLGEAGRKRIGELCDWQKVVDAHLAAYEAALA